VRHPEGRCIQLEVASDETISSLKAKIQAKLGIPAAELILCYAGRPVTTGTLLDYSVQRDCTISILIALPGGSSWDILI
jgi:hypothetical protein